MSKMAKNLLIIGGILLVVILSIGSVYNGLISSEEEVSGKYAIVETDLQRRADLIPNLVESVKAYASHEEDLFTEIAEARTKLLEAENPSDLANAEANLDASLGRLIAISESYPELKASENFIQLQDELAGTENRIAVSRKDYNDVVKEYNKKVKSFPTNLLAGMFGFEEEDYFEASSEAQEVPDVNFE